MARDPRSTRGGFQSPLIEQLDVTLADDSRHTWYSAMVGYSEGYLYELVATHDAAVAPLAGYDARLEAVS